MEEIIKSTLLEYEKSTFIIDLIKHKSGKNYINVQQNIEGKNSQELKINLSVLTDIISVLKNYQKEFTVPASRLSKSYFSEDKQKSVVERYFKGVTIEDLALQFDCSKQIIEQILFNKGIEIVDNNQPTQKKNFRYRRRK